jgi:hypothetical protein
MGGQTLVAPGLDAYTTNQAPTALPPHLSPSTSRAPFKFESDKVSFCRGVCLGPELADPRLLPQRRAWTARASFSRLLQPSKPPEFFILSPRTVREHLPDVGSLLMSVARCCDPNIFCPTPASQPEKACSTQFIFNKEETITLRSLILVSGRRAESVCGGFYRGDHLAAALLSSADSARCF